MIEIIREIENLLQDWHDEELDGAKAETLYEHIGEYVAEKEEFVNESESVLLRMKAGTLSNIEAKNWINYANSKFASFLAVHMLSEENTIRPKEIGKVLSYFQNGNFYVQIAAVGIFACAKLLQEADPMRCYRLVHEAFQKYPDLGYILGTEYRYEGSATEESLTETCPICGSKEVSPHYCSLKRIQKSEFPPGKLWMKCEYCKNYYTYNFPLKSVGKINGHYTRRSTAQILEHRFQLDIYNSIFTKLQRLTDGRVYLEIGIGNGEMLAVAQEFGYQAEAVEICREDCERVSDALDIDIACCDIVEYETEKQYDVIVMGDVFEHVTDPMKVMRKVSAMLKEDGVLWLSTPNYNCAYARMEKFEHCMWHELNHYTYVSYESMKKLLERLNLEVVQYEMSKRYIGSMELFIQRKK